MTNIVAIILGFIEGVTEFIPVSSSGHLIIVRQILGVNNFGGLTFDAVLQLSATLAVLVYFWSDVLDLIKKAWRMIFKKGIVEEGDRVMIYAILIGTIPAVIFGLLFENLMATVFRNAELVALTLVLGSILFWFAEKVAKQDKVLTLGRGIVIGFFQCLAIVPGVSRSGSTISGGLIVGLNKNEAVRFSFLLSLPILLGAGLKKVFEVRHELLSTSFGLSLFLGCVTAFVTGLIAISFLIKYLKTHNLNIFIWYRVILAIIIFLVF